MWHVRGRGEMHTGKPERRTPLAKPRRRWENNIKMDVLEVGWEGHRPDRCGSG